MQVQLQSILTPPNQLAVSRKAHPPSQVAILENRARVEPLMLLSSCTWVILMQASTYIDVYSLVSSQLDTI